MSYIVPDELPKSCSKCPFCYLLMQNPLSSKTPIKRYRCQVGKAPWKTFDVDFYDEEYKDKECPLVPMQEIVERLEGKAFLFPKIEGMQVFNRSFIIGRDEAIEIVKEVGGMND